MSLLNLSDTNCQSILNQGWDLSGTYNISVNGLISPVYCDQTTDGGGWLVIQRNVRNLNFYKSWQEFKHGFGDLDLSFWWGNEKMHQLTWSREFELRVDLKRANGEEGYAKYTEFKVKLYKFGSIIAGNIVLFTLVCNLNNILYLKCEYESEY